MRISHPKFGPGVVLEEFVSFGGQPVARVVFDNSPANERTMLLSCLSESQAPLPEVAKEKPKRKPRAKKDKPEKVSDALLVPELDEGARLDFTSGFESYTESA